MLGSSERLMPYVKDYMRWVVPTLPFGVLMSIGLFVIRLDGSPVFAMLCNALPALLNVVLDYVFVFPMHMGIEGASLATGIAQTSFTLLIGLYMWRYARTIRFYKPKFTKKSIRLTLRNVGCQAKLGISSMIGELAIACMMFTGNLAFLKYLGEDGVAAFSVACYCFPFVFMIGNAIAQSAQPIISYNHGAGLPARVSQTFRLSIGMGLAFGLLAMLGGIARGCLGKSLDSFRFLARNRSCQRHRPEPVCHTFRERSFSSQSTSCASAISRASGVSSRPQHSCSCGVSSL